VFTARYALSPYIKQIRFVFKGLIHHTNVRFRVKWYGVVGIVEEMQTLRECASVLRYTYIDYLVKLQMQCEMRKSTSFEVDCNPA
jgi:hypothetical protein